MPVALTACTTGLDSLSGWPLAAVAIAIILAIAYVVGRFLG
jgi:hypothetical protein